MLSIAYVPRCERVYVCVCACVCVCVLLFSVCVFTRARSCVHRRMQMYACTQTRLTNSPKKFLNPLLHAPVSRLAAPRDLHDGDPAPEGSPEDSRVEDEVVAARAGG